MRAASRVFERLKELVNIRISNLGGDIAQRPVSPPEFKFCQ